MPVSEDSPLREAFLALADAIAVVACVLRAYALEPGGARVVRAYVASGGEGADGFP